MSTYGIGNFPFTYQWFVSSVISHVPRNHCLLTLIYAIQANIDSLGPPVIQSGDTSTSESSQIESVSDDDVTEGTDLDGADTMDLDDADVDLDNADIDLDGADTGLDGTDMDIDGPFHPSFTAFAPGSAQTTTRNSLAASFESSAYFASYPPSFRETNFQERTEDQKHSIGSQIATNSSLMTEDSLAPLFQGGADGQFAVIVDVPMRDA
ncbi:hypothetical protein GYMLUDRAFT_243174 [Collybiopsis luxurians FD-317 M1]|uniref:Uncharacterized protein n=1 Tax=Collybiopsis luxurians FD-317 M1 TaxID=944289 RepID=A0A0D0C1S7_9AGAR|nr:hypothetical protein GYMLUDRAFT_243174 [Collybiopsis luxurians FD-317 M1]